MMFKLKHIFLVFVLAMGVLSCEEEIVSSSTAAPFTTPGLDTVELVIVNRIGVLFYTLDIRAVYISDAGTNDWGNSSGSIRYGSRLTLYMQRGVYDIRCVDSDGDEYIRRNVTMEQDRIITLRILDKIAAS